jgi:hypothetical protein
MRRSDGLDRTDDDRRAWVGFAAALGVDGDGAVGALVGLGVGGVGVVGADLAVGGVAVDHRIHVAGGDAEIQRRLAERAEGVGGVPVGLADDADAVALCFQQAPDQRHAEARVVDVGVAGDEDDVAGVPAERGHLGARHRQEGRRAEARRPVLAMREQGLGHRLFIREGREESRRKAKKGFSTHGTNDHERAGLIRACSGHSRIEVFPSRLFASFAVDSFAVEPTQRTARSSTSNTSVALGGMTPPAPREP